MLNIFILYQMVMILSYTALAMDDIMAMLTESGYPAENHTVSTEDNYLLTVHRIPRKLPGTKVVFVMHGLLLSAADYLVFGPKNSLGYILYDAGFDVWLGNARGTTFSRRHQFLDPNESSAFWDYSFNEIGKFDLPAMIDYVLAATNRRALHYVGHSQGCTSFFVMLALRPNYNAKILSMHAMAPAVYMANSKVVSDMIIAALDQLESLTKFIEMHEMSGKRPQLRMISAILGGMCREKTMLQIVCYEAMFSVIGSTTPQLTQENTGHLMKNTPNIISSKQLIHYGQIIRSGNFQQFDYKKAKNKLLYHQESPPLYDLTHVTCDVQILYGTKDLIVQTIDVERLIAAGGKRVIDVVLVPGANHFDFIYSASGNKDFYSKIIAFIAKYSVT